MRTKLVILLLKNYELLNIRSSLNSITRYGNWALKNTWAVPFFAIILITSTFAFPPYYQIENQAFALDPNDGIVTTVLSPSKDSFITQGSAKDNEGANPNLRIISSDKNRPVIAFDQTEIAAATEGLVFLSATLRLNVVDNGNNWGPDGRLIGSHQILQDWTEGNGWNVGNNISGTGDGITWNCPIDSDISNNLDDCSVQWNGGSFEAVPDSTILITNGVINQYVEFDVTNDVQNFLDGTDANFGWIVKKDDESKNGTIEFASKENTSNHPELVIVAQDPAVLLALEYLDLIVALNDVGINVENTVVTQELIDDVNSDLSRLKEIVIELQDLGFNGEADAVRIAQQTVGTVSFFDSQTSEILFETQIPDGTLALFTSFGMIEEFQEGNVVPTFDQKADLINSSIGIVEIITNLEDENLAFEFVLAGIGKFHPSTGQTFVCKTIGDCLLKIAIQFSKCLRNFSCDFGVNELFMRLAQSGIEGVEETYKFFNPKVTIDITKFEDLNPDGGKATTEDGLGGWTFEVRAFDEPVSVPFDPFSSLFTTTFIDSDETSFDVATLGELRFNEIRIPRSTVVIGVSEVLQDGWMLTSLEGIDRSLPFNADVDVPNIGDVKVYDREFFGNLQEAKLTVIKNIINDDGGTLTIADVTLKINSAIVTSGAENILSAGTFQVSEEPISDYDATISGDCDANGFVTLDGGAEKTCIITNNDVPPFLFFEDFAGIAGWSQTSCILNHPPGQTCNIGLTPALLPVPSLPNWGFVETFDFVPGCQQLGPNVEARFSHPFTVTTNGTFTLSSWVGTSPCTTCDIFSQLLVDGDAKISVKGRNLLFDPPQNRTTFQQATFDMTQGEHQITMRSFTPGGMCFGNFRTFFDDITIVGSTSPLTGPMTGGPYFYPEINQTSVNATKPTTVTVPLKVEWFEGYYAEPVEIHVVGNLTDIGISSTVTSVMNSTHYKLFYIVFDIPDSATIGEHFINIFVKETDSGDREIETIQLNVE